MSRLKITEIFHSLQGEADTAGVPTTFVRLTGCPLRCQYCDTAYAFHGGEWWEIDAILERVRALGNRHVCVTGGEPLAQKTCVELLERLSAAGFRVSLETSGAMSLQSRGSARRQSRGRQDARLRRGVPQSLRRIGPP